MDEDQNIFLTSHISSTYMMKNRCSYSLSRISYLELKFQVTLMFTLIGIDWMYLTHSEKAIFPDILSLQF